MESSEELELKTTESDYQKLKEGTSLSVSWQGKNLVSFVMEQELWDRLKQNRSPEE